MDYSQVRTELGLCDEMDFDTAGGCGARTEGVLSPQHLGGRDKKIDLSLRPVWAAECLLGQSGIKKKGGGERMWREDGVGKVPSTGKWR